MIKILFICHGNICRSPMCEFVMKDLVNKAGRADQFEIASAATSTEELGNPVHPGTRRELAKHGISCEGKRARQVTRADYDRYDMLICADRNNIRNLRRITGGDPDGKISLVLDHTSRPGRDVDDPWYSGDFESTWNDVSDGCAGLLRELTEKD